MLSEEYFYVTQKYPEKCKFITDRLDELSAIEARRDPDPDAGARCFGRLLGEIFAEGPDALWRERLRVLGQELGEFIYIMDAVLDLEGDRAGGRYNAVAAFAEGKTEDDLRYTLTMLIGECAAVFERLPVVRDADIMRNILYSGVWLRYNMEMARRHGKEGGEPVES